MTKKSERATIINYNFQKSFYIIFQVNTLSLVNMKNQQTNQGSLSIPLKTRSRSRPPQVLNIRVDTWSKQSHGLFDYQSDPAKIQKEYFQVNQPVKILRDLNTRKTLIHNSKNKEKQQGNIMKLFNIHYNQAMRMYSIRNSLSTSLQQVLSINGAQKQKQIERNRLFTSLYRQGTGHQLKIGDFIKLGRVQLLVLQINNTKKSQALDYQQVYGTKQFVFHLNQQLYGACKICFIEEGTQEDPLLNPCLCKGSLGVIHLQCLRTWINTKVRKQILGTVMTYNFDKFSCQICMAPFPSIVRLENGSEQQLLKFERPTGPYLLMQQCYQTETKSARILHFVMPEQNRSIKIGRAQLCQLMISDISVSRTHSSIKFSHNKFTIFDQGSKFGTLVELKQEKKIKEPLRLQHNGCIIDISLAIPQKKQKSSQSAKKNKISQKKIMSNMI